MNLKEMDVKDLKALAYDQLATMEACQNNLKLINAEIALKTSIKKNGKEEAVEQVPV